MKNFSYHNRTGAVLLLSLLLMSSVVATTISISIIITNDFTQTRAVEDFTRASFAADAGIERGLAFIEAGRRSTDFATSIASAGVDAMSPVSVGQATVSVTVAPGLSQPTFTLPGNGTVSLDIINDDVSDDITRLSVTNTNAGQIEVRWNLITKSGNPGAGRSVLNMPENTTSTINLLNVASASENTPNTFNGNDVIGYRLQIKNPGASALSSISLKGLTESLIERSLTSTVVITAAGSSFDANATKEVRTLWQRPASGLFNYVIYAEGDIVPTPQS